MAFEIKGIVKRVGPTEQKSEKFSKRVIWLEVEDGKYPQTVELQATGDRCGMLDEIHPGDEVAVKFNLRGREWTGKDGVAKVFNSLDVWKLERTSAAQSAPPPDSFGGDIPF